MSHSEHWGNCPHDGSTDDVLASALEYHERPDTTCGAVSWITLEDGRVQTSAVGFQVYEDDERTRVITAESFDDQYVETKVMERMSALAGIRACAYIRRELKAMEQKGDL